MKNRSELEEELSRLLGGYCWSQDGGNNGNTFEELVDFIQSLLDEQQEEILKELETGENEFDFNRAFRELNEKRFRDG